MYRFLLSSAAGLATLIAAGDAYASPKPPKHDREYQHHGHGDYRGGPKGHGDWRHSGYAGYSGLSTGRYYSGGNLGLAVRVLGALSAPTPYQVPIYQAAPAYAPPVYQPPVYTPPTYQPAPVYTPPAYQPAPVYTPPASVYAPPAVAAPADPVALVHQWYRRYLGREGDPGGVATWVDSLRQGNPPDAVLATILASDEYFLRAGGSVQGLVQLLFADLTGRQPTAEEYGYWLDRLARGYRVDVIRELLVQYPQP